MDFILKISLRNDEQYVSDLLRILACTPMYTTMRLHTQKMDMQSALDTLRSYLNDQCQDNGREEFKMYPHPQVKDCILIENRGLYCIVELEKEVIVDSSCGMAVLRGANVYVQGILGAPRSLRQGDWVSVFADLGGKCLKGFAENYKGKTLFVGNGISQVSRSDLFNSGASKGGLGILMSQPVLEAPSLNDLPFPWLFAQNLPSIYCSHCLDPQPGETILDMCAAPGGKTLHIASLMQDEGLLIALEKSPSRASKMKKLVTDLNVNVIKCFPFNSIAAVSLIPGPGNSPPYLPATFDRILVDAPCSALGQRPSHVNNISLSQLKSFPVIQQKLLITAEQLLKPGGVLVYSTCTICTEENEKQVQGVLNKCPTLELMHLPYQLGVSGLVNSGLPADLCDKVTRFDPSLLISDTHPEDVYNRDTIGFFIAKFKKRQIQ